MIAGFFRNPKIPAQIVNDVLGVGFTVTIIHKKIDSEIDVRFTKV